MIFGGQPKVEFTCSPELHGIIPEPTPARANLPDWFKNLKQFSSQNHELEPEEFSVKTIKRCPPVLDAMVSGWIIPLQSAVDVKVSDDLTNVMWGSSRLTVFEPHSGAQIEGHPDLPKPPIKAMNHWHIKTPPGWSMLFVPPLNHPNDIFVAMSGIVDTDSHTENINFPGFFVKPGMSQELEAGMPIVQAIPFKRGFKRNAVIRSRSKSEEEVHVKNNARYANIPGEYRRSWWVKK